MAQNESSDYQKLDSSMSGKGSAEAFPKGKNSLDKEAGVSGKDSAQYKDVDNQKKQAGAE